MPQYRRSYLPGETFFLTLVTYCRCPLWAYSSFTRWVERESYSADWGCVCGGKVIQIPDFKDIADRVGE